MSRRDLRLLALLTVPPLLLFGLRWLLGDSYYWGDLTYIHFGWRAGAADMIQRGVLPLWNPYAYFGMPLAGQMQSAVWYPGTLPFYLFGFSSALPLYHILHFWLAGVFTYLWLRRSDLGRGAAFAGALAAMLCGGMVSRIPFLNHVATISLLPALALLAARPTLLALTLALAFFSGYPTMLAGAATAALFFDGLRTWTLRTAPRRAAGWAAAALLAAAVSACLLAPALELAAGSRRGGGLTAQETLTWSLTPRDLRQLTAPPLIPRAEFRPDTLWWKTTYFGWGVCAAAAAGLFRLPPAQAAALLGYLFAVVLLLLGGSNGASAWLWTHLWPLKFVRYPGNMAYLLIPALVWLAAQGLHRRRWAPWAALVICAELFAYAWISQPTVPHEHYASAGPLVPIVRREAGEHRYLLSPRALQWHRGLGAEPQAAAMDLKHRLYGVTNTPFRLYSAGNFGEPLVPKDNYDWMDFLYSRRSSFAAVGWFPWLDIRLMMTREPQPPGDLRYLGTGLWHLYRHPWRIGRAYHLPTDMEPSDERPDAPPDIYRARRAEFSRPREDRFEAAGEGAGWLYVAEPAWPGWRAELNGEPAVPRRALGGFLKLRVPDGAWRVRWRYRPSSWRLGAATSVLVLCALTAYWYNRLRRRAAS